MEAVNDEGVNDEGDVNAHESVCSQSSSPRTPATIGEPQNLGFGTRVGCLSTSGRSPSNKTLKWDVSSTKDNAVPPPTVPPHLVQIFNLIPPYLRRRTQRRTRLVASGLHQSAKYRLALFWVGGGKGGGRDG